jgi:hypothetical protein
MTEKREVTKRRGLLRKAATEKSAAFCERIADVVDRAHLILTDKDFANVLRAEGVQSVPGCLGRPPTHVISNSTPEKELLDEISLEFVIVWKFPSYSTPYLKSKDRMAFTGSFGDKSWSRNSII